MLKPLLESKISSAAPTASDSVPLRPEICRRFKGLGPSGLGEAGGETATAEDRSLAVAV